MKGTVKFINERTGKVGIETDGGFSVIEVLGDISDFEIGDGITGNLHNLGGEKIFNTRPGEILDVFIHDCQCSVEVMKGLLSV